MKLESKASQSCEEDLFLSHIDLVVYPNTHKKGKGRHISFVAYAASKEKLEAVVTGLGELANCRLAQIERPRPLWNCGQKLTRIFFDELNEG